MALPPPLLVPASHSGDSTSGKIKVAGAVDDTGRELVFAFGRVLSASRAARGFEGPLTLHPALGDQRPAVVDGQTWVPHVFCFKSTSHPGLVWEQCPLVEVERKLGATAEEVERWAARPAMLWRLLTIAVSTGQAVEAPTEQPHLSFRWILANQEVAAEAAGAGLVEVEHVSIHIDPDEEETVVRLLVDALGLIEIPRPAEIAVPGRWLQAGRCRVHLNSRSGRPDEIGFPGPRPNHICFGVDDLDGAENALEAAGVSTRRAGSLDRQLWFRLAGTTVELQPLRR